MSKNKLGDELGTMTNLIYLGIAIAGYFAVKKLSNPSQSGYQQISLEQVRGSKDVYQQLSAWRPMTQSDMHYLGIC